MKRPGYGVIHAQRIAFFLTFRVSVLVSKLGEKKLQLLFPSKKVGAREVMPFSSVKTLSEQSEKRQTDKII